MERSDICQEQMKRRVKTKYFKRVISVLHHELLVSGLSQQFDMELE